MKSDGDSLCFHKWHMYVYVYMYTLVVIVAVLGIKPKASHRLGKFSAAELYISNPLLALLVCQGASLS